MKKFSCIFCLLLLFSVFCSAQTPTPTPDEDDSIVKISTTLIQVDVTVTDQKGKIVANLKPEDFEIYENGKLQKLTNFSFVDSAPENQPIAAATKPNKNEVGAAVPPVKLRPEQVRRTIALVVDDLGLSYESIYTVRLALRKFVDQQMQPNDLVAIIRTGSGMGALQQFTSDKNILYAAIDNVRWNPTGRAGISAFEPIEPTFEEQIALNGGDPRMTKPEVSEEAKARIQAAKDRMASFNGMRDDLFSIGTLGAINYVVKGMNELPGRKSIMLFSDGFSICTNADIKNDAGRCARMRDSIQRLTDLSNRAAITIYTQDARGLAFDGMTAQDNISMMTQNLGQSLIDRANELRDKQQGLSFLANETGGRATFNSNNLNLGIEKMLEETKGFYLLGYQPDAETFDAKTRRFNKLTVKVKQDDLKVSYRSGFFGIADEDVRKAAETRAETPLQQIIKSLASPFAANDIDLKLNALFGRDEKNGPFVHSLLHVDANNLKFTDAPGNSKQATFDVLAISYGENGAIVDQVSKNYTITVKNEEYQKILNDGFVYNFVFPIKKSGAYQIRVALRDAETAKVGSASQFIEIPDLKKENLTLSGILLENMTAAQWSENSSVQDAPQRTFMMDTSLRKFKKDTILRYNTEVYNARLDQTRQPQLQTQIRLFHDGKIVLNGKEKAFNSGAQSDPAKLNFTGAIGLGNELKPGDYVLQIIVIDKLAKGKNKLTTQWVEFELTD